MTPRWKWPVQKICSSGTFLRLEVTSSTRNHRKLHNNKFPKRKKLEYGLVGNVIVSIGGSGLYTQLNHKKWMHQIRLLSPAFHQGYLKGLVPQFNSVASTLVTKFTKVADGKTVVDMADELQKATLDVIGKGMYKSARKEAIENCQARPNDLMGMILQASQFDHDVNMKDLVDEFCAFFIAGKDTTANQVGFALLEILLNERIENRICQEVDIVLGNKDTVEYDDISKLQFVRQTLKESLRKHPPASGTLRRTTKPEKFGSFLIPKGANINFPIYVAHHLPENWCDPECFIPDRFSDKNNSENKLSNFEYFRFSCGQRICMGKDFSNINASIVMAQLFRKFKFELVAGQTLQCEEKMTMRPKDRVLCTIKKRATRA